MLGSPSTYGDKRESLWDRHELRSDKTSPGNSANSSHSLARTTPGHDFRTHQVRSLVLVLIEHPRVFYQTSLYVTYLLLLNQR